MSVDINIEAAGVKEVASLLESFSKPSLQRQAVRPGVRAAGAVFRKEAKGLAPQDQKLLKKSLQVVVRTSRNGSVYAAIGPEYKKVNGKNPAKYAHLTEDGVKPHKIGNVFIEYENTGESGFYRSVNHPGFKGRKWMKKAFVRKNAAARQVLLNKTREQYYKIVDKRRKAGKSI